jgi:hypothetical protein
MTRRGVGVAVAAALLAGCSTPESDSGGGEDAALDAREEDALALPDAHDAATRDGDDGSTDARDDGDGAMTDGYDGGLWVNQGACGVGEIGAVFRGVPAYCQPTSATGYYQCDELANRYMRDALQHADLDNVVSDFASSICAKASAMSTYSVWGPGYGSTSGRQPEAGDLVVYTGMPGHVAVVVGFADPTDVTIMQQNAGSSVATVGWDPAASFFTVANAECWVHAEVSPPAKPPGGPSCGCFAGGPGTCGLAIVDHEGWYGCTASVPDGGVAYDSLYTCDAGAFTKTQDCPARCITPNLFDASGACGP